MSNTLGGFSIVKPNMMSLDINQAEQHPKGSIFHNKRNTQQPNAMRTTQMNDKRPLINESDPLRMNNYAKQAMKKTGC